MGRRRCSSGRLCHHFKSRASCFILFVLSFWKSSGCFEFSVVKWLALLVSWKLEFWRGAYHDAEHKGALALVQTVRGNYEGYTKREVLKAKEVHRAQAMMGNPSKKDYKTMVSNNLIPECPITSMDITMREPYLVQISRAYKEKRYGRRLRRWWRTTWQSREV